MRRSRRNKSPAVTLIMWSAAGVLVGWGVWQAALFRRTLIADVATNDPTATAAGAPSDPAAVVEAGGDPPATVAEPEIVSDTLDGEDQWANAMTPATGDDDAAPGIAIEGNTPDELQQEGAALVEEGRIAEGRAMLNAALGMLTDGPRAQAIRVQLAALNGAVYLGSAVLPDDAAARLVEIEAGDSFLKLGQRYSVPAAFLEAINPNLSARSLKPATGVKIVQGPFHLRMSKAARRLDLFARDTYVCSFSAQVSAGDYLPSGIYRIAGGTKLQVGQREWIGIEGISEATRDVSLGWLYGDAGPRMSKSDTRVSGVKLRDSDLATLYNVLVETRSLLRVDP